ncbi:hypothetical protein [Streptomyces lavendofoliae]|uniref:Uncharacterized protein n=1 Tax=Streptomyces lavendofoliae TaxID=67314 RepID=A0A918HX31_9ACTN|nr:hypothetical protein [Streptomyces lavendofoliae]GGU38077.1 hypothetical protein GCM10010274_26730 [Streptomyces lavendofoliae]
MARALSIRAPCRVRSPPDEKWTVEPPRTESSVVTGPALSPHGRTLMTTTDSGDGITVRDAGTGRKPRVLPEATCDGPDEAGERCPPSRPTAPPY